MRNKLFSQSVLIHRFTSLIAASTLLVSGMVSAQESAETAAPSTAESASTEGGTPAPDTTEPASPQPVTPPAVQPPQPITPAPVYPTPTIPKIFTEQAAASAVNAPPAPPVGQKRAGFAMELAFSIGKPLVAIDEELMDFSSVNGGIFLGGKINRVIVGMGFALTHFKYRSSYRNDEYLNSYGSSSYSSSSGSTFSTEQKYEASVTSFVFKPGVRFDLVRSRDEKVSLFGQIDLGAGTLLYKEKENGEAPPEDEQDDEKRFLLEWDGGLGVRYFVHPQFAVSAFGGAMGSFYFERDTDDDSKYSHHIIGLSAAFQLLGVF